MFWDYADEPKHFVFKTVRLSKQKLYMKSYTRGEKKRDATGNKLPFRYVCTATRFFLCKENAMISFIIDGLGGKSIVDDYLIEAKYKLRKFLEEGKNG